MNNPNQNRRRIRARLLLPLGLALALAAGSALPASAASSCYPKCAASYASLVDALASVGADGSFAARKEIAGANGVANYTGTAAQNIQLLNLLKSGALLRPGSALTVTASSAPLDANLGAVKYIAQGTKTCKATAVAMAVNLLRGTDVCTTAGMGGSCCASIEGAAYTGSNGVRYTGVYKTDAYVGSAKELTDAIATALAAGVPIVAPVHSTAGGTKHHWVVVVGRSGSDYRIVDPAYGVSGTMAANTVTLSGRNYAFGLTDYAAPHYGYVTFT